MKIFHRFKKDSANVTCRFCSTNVRLSEGVKALSKHSGTAKHKNAKSARSLTGTIQRSFSAQVDALKQARSIEAQAIDAEIMYLHHVEAHGISPHAAGCAGRLFQQMFPDSKIAAKMTFSDSKQGYEITHGLGPYYNDQLVARLRCEFFSVNIDESTVLKTSQLALTVRYFHRNQGRIVCEHYKTINIVAKDAATLVDVLRDTFVADGINYEKLLISIETDSCPTMRGIRGGVITRMHNTMEYMYDLGGCPDHHIANALKYGLLAFDKSMKTIFVDVYEDLEKYPSHQLRYTDACKEVGIVAKPIIRMVDTRWTIIGSCAARLFAQFAALEHMYGKLSLTKKDAEARDESRLYRLVMRFTGHATPLLKLKLLFLEHAASAFHGFIKILEKSEPMIHVQHEILGRLILTHMATYIKQSAIEITTYDELVHVDHTNNRLPHKDVVLPEPVVKLMEELGIGPKKLVSVFNSFMDSVLAFNAKCTDRLLHYCDVQLTSKIVICLSALDPSKRSSDITIPAKVMKLQKKYANVVLYTEREKLAAETRDYQTASVTDIPSAWSAEERETEDGTVEVLLDVSTYWSRVGQLKQVAYRDGEVITTCRFPLLFKLAAALLSIHHSAAEVERAFSVEKEVLTLKRNKMTQSTFNAHMLIHNNVKSLGGCQHVKHAITADMRKAYTSASSARNKHLEKQKAKETTEARDLAYNHQRKRKTYAELHRYKLGELAKHLATEATATTSAKRPVPANAGTAKKQKK